MSYDGYFESLDYRFSVAAKLDTNDDVASTLELDSVEDLAEERAKCIRKKRVPMWKPVGLFKPYIQHRFLTHSDARIDASPDAYRIHVSLIAWSSKWKYVTIYPFGDVPNNTILNSKAVVRWTCGTLSGEQMFPLIIGSNSVVRINVPVYVSRINMVTTPLQFDVTLKF